ncbi:hypothetical protein Q2490_17110 [Myroides odoratimimus]|uniref:hypothetical protein n=1 Tax=Myroides odoratimimus TaxID=76832 RepID=UPI0026E08147|nr:hypothetical protein [Myroides odoratimimus]MDO5858999.1 hypothetical protein [Myroides odoratimimus]
MAIEKLNIEKKKDNPTRISQIVKANLPPVEYIRSTEFNAVVDKVNEIIPEVNAGVTGYQGKIYPTDKKEAIGFYFAAESGVYPYAGNFTINIAEGINHLMFDGTKWDKMLTPIEATGKVEEGNKGIVSGEEVFKTSKKSNFSIGNENILNNSYFDEGLEFWNANQSELKIQVNDIGNVEIDSEGTKGPGFYQFVPILNEYEYQIRLRKLGGTDMQSFVFGLVGSGNRHHYTGGGDFQTITGKITRGGLQGRELVFIPEVGDKWEIEYIICTNDYGNDLSLKNQIQKISTTEASFFSGYSHLLVNGFFNREVSNWSTNQDRIVLKVTDNTLRIDGTNASDPAITQNVILNSSKQYFEVKLKRIKGNSKRVRIGISDNPSVHFIENENETVVLSGYLENSIGRKLFMLATDGGNTYDVDYIVFADVLDNNVSLKNQLEQASFRGYTSIVDNNDFSNKSQYYWQTNDVKAKLTIKENIAILDAGTSADPAIVQNKEVQTGIYKCQTKFRYIKNSRKNMSIRLGIIHEDNLLNFTYDKLMEWQEYSFYCEIKESKKAIILLATASDTIAEIEYLYFDKVEEGTQAWDNYIIHTLNYDNLFIPNIINTRSPIYSELKNFTNKYYAKDKDICIVQTGDSISTNLKWSLPRLDAKYRPPLMTEYNFNSHIEEMLRYKDMRYNRFDVQGVFTEILGGGNSLEKEVDLDNWGYCGAAFYYPLTKVIDGGVNSGVSFVMRTHIRRLNLIVHTDKSWADNTEVIVQQGNGVLLVYNGFEWIEANGYITSFKELDTKQDLGFYTDNYQKRLKFKAVNPYSDINVTVINKGEGRFGYWGLEETRSSNTFTYIAASKGSHSDPMLKKYDKWMIEEHKPNLIIYQCPIINHGIGTARVKSSEFFGKQFVDRAIQLKDTNNCPVVSYAAWGASPTNLFNSNGDFIELLSQEGGFISCEADVLNIAKEFNVAELPFINAFSKINEIAEIKSQADKQNKYHSTLIKSGRNGRTFTIDGSHLNTRGEKVLWSILKPYFNF